jgi:hypothetical protein
MRRRFEPIPDPAGVLVPPPRPPRTAVAAAMLPEPRHPRMPRAVRRFRLRRTAAALLERVASAAETFARAAHQVAERIGGRA